MYGYGSGRVTISLPVQTYGTHAYSSQSEDWPEDWSTPDREPRPQHSGRYSIDVTFGSPDYAIQRRALESLTQILSLRRRNRSRAQCPLIEVPINGGETPLN